jgi:transcriptional regulator with XRE-family HTH domain
MAPRKGRFAQELGARVRAIREARSLTQEGLGERAGLHATQIGHIERGERNIRLNTLLKVAAALSVEVGELANGLPHPEF